MSKLKIKMDFARIATIKTTKGQSPVGSIEEFKQNPDGTLEFTVKLDPTMPVAVREAIEKNPGLLGISGIPKVTDYLIIAEIGETEVAPL